MKTRKLLSIILAISLCVGIVAPTMAAPDVLASSDEDVVEAANRLYGLRLFSGVGDNADGTPNYDLAGTLNRQEAVTMLVRLLGKESEALAGSWTSPFSDVADWAKPYVGYAYENGLTSGTSAITFGGTDSVNATQYLTFVLRALGYSSDSDFAWDAAWELTDELGITNGEYGEGVVLVRGDAALVSANALDVTMKDGGKTLLGAIEESLGNGSQTNENGADDTNEVDNALSSSEGASEGEIESSKDVPARANAAAEGVAADDSAPSEPTFEAAYELELKDGSMILFSKAPIRIGEYEYNVGSVHELIPDCTVERETTMALLRDSKLIPLSGLDYILPKFGENIYEITLTGQMIDALYDGYTNRDKNEAFTRIVQEKHWSGTKEVFNVTTYPKIHLTAELTVPESKPFTGKVGNNGWETDKYADEAYNDPKNFIVNASGTLTAYNGTGKDMHVIVPYDVKTIQSGVFENRDDIVSLTIPDTVTLYYEYMLEGCDNITDLYVGDGIMHSYSKYTTDSTGLSVYEDQDGSKLDDYLFFLPSIENFYVSDGNPFYTGIDGVVFMGDPRDPDVERSTLYSYPRGRTTGDYKIPDGTNIIESRIHTDGVVTIPASVYGVDRGIFDGKTRVILERHYLPSPLHTIAGPDSYIDSLWDVFGFPDDLNIRHDLNQDSK